MPLCQFFFNTFPSYLTACGEGRHCELQPGHHGEDSQPASQLHVCVAVTPPPHASPRQDLKLSLVSIDFLFFAGWGNLCKSVLSVFLCVSEDEQTVWF